MKLIFKFSNAPCNRLYRNELERKIKEFHEQSLIIFENDLDSIVDIIVLEDENNDKENN
jgi:hypothetical protein